MVCERCANSGTEPQLTPSQILSLIQYGWFTPTPCRQCQGTGTEPPAQPVGEPVPVAEGRAWELWCDEGGEG